MKEAMPMAQMMQAKNDAPDDLHSVKAKHDRLQKLVSELLLTNEQLRLKVAQLEQRSERTARALDEASAIYGLLLP
jgi:predicted  nucleic acid-binding Zn-ribbon protein